MGTEEGGQRAGQECGKGWGPSSAGALDSVPSWLLDMRSMIDPKLFKEVSWEVLTAPLPALFKTQASALGGPFLGVLSPRGLPQSPKGILQAGPCPHCSQGSQRLVVPKSLSWHTCPPLIFRSLGQAPSPLSSEILEIGSLLPLSSGIILHRNPRRPLPLFLKIPPDRLPS